MHVMSVVVAMEVRFPQLPGWVKTGGTVSIAIGGVITWVRTKIVILVIEVQQAALH